ncbi:MULTISPECIES: putative zinc-binding protein [unclassified Methanoculleus]|uniref:Zinc-binding protein n=1 Tax=Methanoculleus palmolei TaxID=72612 RepID=A0ABD8ABA5_9EURY|nr:putative zinc-binding protein [Methanoculleus sp. UBA377]WOX56450.1 putative zinc-binding protein [Methanoculleus palmolei]
MAEPVTLVTCSGLSNTGKLTARAGMVVWQRYPESVEALLPANRPPASLEEATRSAGRVLALDGCEDTCALKKLREIGVEPDLHVVATGCGIVKNGMAEPRFDEIERLVGVVIGAIRDGQQP